MDLEFRKRCGGIEKNEDDVIPWAPFAIQAVAVEVAGREDGIPFDSKPKVSHWTGSGSSSAPQVQGSQMGQA